MTYNGVAHIRACLTSLLAGVVDGHQVLVVDNASDDGTIDLVRREFPSVRVLPSTRNVGYGVAGNQGAAISTSEYLAIMNQDLVSTADWVNRLVAALDDDPTAALATPKILVRDDPTCINACGNVPHFTGITSCRGYGQPASAYAIQEHVAAVSGAAFVIRRAVFDELGGFDASFFLYLEDTDLSLRAMLARQRCLTRRSPWFCTISSPGSLSAKLFFLERNRYSMLLKLYRWPTLVMLVPALLLTEFAVWGYAVLGGPRQLWAKARAHAWVVGHIGTIRRARRRTQSARRVTDRSILQMCIAELPVDELPQRPARLAMAVTAPLFRAWYRLILAVVTW